MLEVGVKDILIRKIEVSVVEKLKAKAKKQNRSLQAEMKIALQNAASRLEPMSEQELIRKIRESNTKTNRTNSADLLREDRDR